MDQALVSLLAASIAFVGTHFALSHPLRAPLVGALGDGGFMGLYSVVAAGCMAWMYFAFTAAPGADLGGSGTHSGGVGHQPAAGQPDLERRIIRDTEAQNTAGAVLHRLHRSPYGGAWLRTSSQ